MSVCVRIAGTNWPTATRQALTVGYDCTLAEISRRTLERMKAVRVAYATSNEPLGCFAPGRTNRVVYASRIRVAWSGRWPTAATKRGTTEAHATDTSRDWTRLDWIRLDSARLAQWGSMCDCLRVSSLDDVLRLRLNRWPFLHKRTQGRPHHFHHLRIRLHVDGQPRLHDWTMPRAASHLRPRCEPCARRQIRLICIVCCTCTPGHPALPVHPSD